MFHTVDAVNPQRIEHALKDTKELAHHKAVLTHSWQSEYREAGLPQACLQHLEAEQEEEGWIYSSELNGSNSTLGVSRYVSLQLTVQIQKS